MTAPISRPPASPSSVGPTASNQTICMSFGPGVGEAGRVAQHERSTGASGAGIRPAGLSAISKPGVAACSLRFAPTGSPSSTPTPERSRIAGEWIAPALDDHLAGGDLLAGRGPHADRAAPVEQHPVDEDVAAHRRGSAGSRAGSRYASFVDTRRPSRNVSATRLTPVASGAW